MTVGAVIKQQITGAARNVSEQSVGSGETGDWILIEGLTASISCFPSGTAKVQYTTSRPKKIRDDVARAIDWARGNVTTACTDIPEGPVTAVRVVSVIGDAVIEVVC